MRRTKRKRDIPGPKPAVWRGRKNCKRCTRWRPVSDYPVYMTRTGYEQIKHTCEYCKREIERERYNRLTPEQKRVRGERANKHNKKRRDQALAQIEQQRKNLDKQNHEIELLTNKVERHRKGHKRIKQTANGHPAGDIIPFRMWLLRQHRESGYNLNELAEMMDRSPSRVRHWLDGFEWDGAGRDPIAIRSIDLYVVDEIGVKLGDPGLLERLYPLEAEEDV